MIYFCKTKRNISAPLPPLVGDDDDDDDVPVDHCYLRLTVTGACTETLHWIRD